MPVRRLRSRPPRVPAGTRGGRTTWLSPFLNSLAIFLMTVYCELHAAGTVAHAPAEPGARRRSANAEQAMPGSEGLLDSELQPEAAAWHRADQHRGAAPYRTKDSTSVRAFDASREWGSDGGRELRRRISPPVSPGRPT